MSIFNLRRRPLAVAATALLLITLSLVATSDAPAARQARQNNPTPVASIRATPPAPVFDDAERRAELAARRERVAKELGASGVLLLFSAEPRVYTGDVDYKYRQENNLFYLTHLNQQGATLVLMPDNPNLREILFLPRRNPAYETWNGYTYSAEDARRISGIREIWDSREFAPFMQSLASRQPYRPKPGAVLLSETASADAATPAPAPPATSAAPPSQDSSAAAQPATTTANANTGFEKLFAASARNEAALFMLLPLREVDTGEFGDAREWRREQRFAEDWKKKASGFNLRSAFQIFGQMRLRKSHSELRLMQHAIDISTEAHGRAMASAASARWEYEVEAEVLYTFKRRNADAPGYPSIVGSGANATTIHYEESQGRVAPADLILMDVGAEYSHYTADITRTFPASGRFTSAQADIYRIVLAAQEAGIDAVRPGATMSDVHNAALAVLKDGLLRLGLITSRDSPQYFLWYPHGTSHWLGMNAHDVGFGNSKFEPGMVLTVEPGLYVRADALENLPKTPDTEKFIAAVRPAFEKYKNIGVRIEDDILVTPDGHKNLSAALPRTIPDIEAFISRASREVR